MVTKTNRGASARTRRLGNGSTWGFGTSRYIIPLAIILTGLACSSGSGGDDAKGEASSGSPDVSSNADDGSPSEPNIITGDPGTSPTPDNGPDPVRVALCGTAEPDSDTKEALGQLFNDYRQTRAARAGVKATTTIPVRFHVISKGSSYEDGEVSDDALTAQVDVLNRAYSGGYGGVSTPYRFQLAGIDRVRRSEWHEFYPGEGADMDARRALRAGGTETLNVYVVKIREEERGIILGYSSLPFFIGPLAFYDGIALHFKALPGGPIRGYNTGRVLVHEAGHWLGLLHTFTGECDGLIDDLIGDTPREKIPEAGNLCPVNRDSCPGEEGADPIHNHMTYTGDECRTEFTEGQVQFMNFNTSLFRGLGG